MGMAKISGRIFGAAPLLKHLLLKHDVSTNTVCVRLRVSYDSQRDSAWEVPCDDYEGRKPAPSYFAYECHPHTMNGHVPHAFNYSVNENSPSLNPMEAKMPRKKKSG